MKYKQIEFNTDRYFVGLKYPSLLSSQRLDEVDLPSFWITFSEQFMNRHVSHLVQKEEAIGYMKRTLNSNYEYTAACEVTEFGETSGFEKIVIPKGPYLSFEISFRHKDRDIRSVYDFVRNESHSEINADLSYCLEYYPESFNHEDEHTSLYFMVPLKEN
ncbi:GyrI-like domain-containing protein [Guptibacillus algicola]|uniref:GyrI-like domain-containing protein n=1 Tax=Guptibacillus algicola TaxID=225844 RepID=UPI001CD26884|nr:GyrI-like domain-containing protein [Alkalihalobacillus algicola]MCA0988492.1 GyrI-like domain-containing protein [Alkalihalobacillus algicola]